MTNRVIIKTLELSPAHRHQTAADLADDLHVALRRLKGESGALTSATIMCQRCGKQTSADAPRCQHCGQPPRPATIGAAAAQSTARRPVPPPVAPTATKSPPGSGGLGNQPPGSGGLGKPAPGNGGLGGGSLGNQPLGGAGLGSGGLGSGGLGSGSRRAAKPVTPATQINRGTSSGFLLDTGRQSGGRPAAQAPTPATTTQHASLGVTRTREERAVAAEWRAEWPAPWRWPRVPQPPSPSPSRRPPARCPPPGARPGTTRHRPAAQLGST